MYIRPKIRTYKKPETSFAPSRMTVSAESGKAADESKSRFREALDNILSIDWSKNPFKTEYIDYSSEDIDRFLFDKEQDYFASPEEYRGALKSYYETLMHDYGASRSFFHSGSDPLSTGISPFSMLDTWLDYKNYTLLLETALAFRLAINRGYIDEINLKALGVEIVKFEGNPIRLECSIVLEDSSSIVQFLKHGVEYASSHNHVVKLVPKNNSQDCILCIQSHLLDKGPNFYKGCIDIMNALNAVMLHDLSIEFNMGELELVSRSRASSIWCALLDSFQKRGVKQCVVCGKTFLTHGKGSKKTTCSDSCRKKKSRLGQYEKYIQEGLDETSAAKKAQVSLEEAKKFLQRAKEGQLVQEK